MGSKSERLAIRVAAADKERLARAAAIQRRSVSEFVLASSREAAEQVLGEQTRFRLPPARHRALLAALDAPVREIAALKRLFSRRSVLER
jgi:uncharacterized protein (DUF1778 family)